LQNARFDPALGADRLCVDAHDLSHVVAAMLRHLYGGAIADRLGERRRHFASGVDDALVLQELLWILPHQGRIRVELAFAAVRHLGPNS